MMTLSQTAQIFPEMMDRIDPDLYATKLAEYMGVPADAMRDDKAVAQVREERAAQQKQQQEMEQAQVQAQVVKDSAQGAKAMGEAMQGGQGAEQIQ